MRWVLGVLLIVAMGLAGGLPLPVSAQDDRAQIERFIRGIYAEYADSSINAPRRSLTAEAIYTPAINTKVAQDVAAANGDIPDGPAHGFSWLIVGQDYEDIVLDEVTITSLTADRATVRVRFDNMRPVTLGITLAKVAAGWRIADIDFGREHGGNLRAMLGLGPVPAATLNAAGRSATARSAQSSVATRLAAGQNLTIENRREWVLISLDTCTNHSSPDTGPSYHCEGQADLNGDGRNEIIARDDFGGSAGSSWSIRDGAGGAALIDGVYAYALAISRSRVANGWPAIAFEGRSIMDGAEVGIGANWVFNGRTYGTQR